MASNVHRSTTRVLDILELLSKNSGGFSLTELSARLNAPKSSLFPIIHTMEDRNFIFYNAATSKYHIGLTAYLTGSSYESPKPVYDFICSQLKKIVAETRETCHLGILRNSDVLYIAKEEVQTTIMLRSQIGNQLPAYCTGIGKALIYTLSLEELQTLYPEGLKAYTENTITSFDVLWEELQEVKRTGFAYEHAELTRDIVCIAVPLRHGSLPIASLSICAPAFRADEARLREFGKILKESQAIVESLFRRFNVTDSSCLI